MHGIPKMFQPRAVPKNPGFFRYGQCSDGCGWLECNETVGFVSARADGTWVAPAGDCTLSFRECRLQKAPTATASWAWQFSFCLKRWIWGYGQDWEPQNWMCSSKSWHNMTKIGWFHLYNIWPILWFPMCLEQWPIATPKTSKNSWKRQPHSIA